MHIDILGPLEIRGREGRVVRLPSGRERALLALLLIHRGEVVSTDRILDALWGAQPPGTAVKAVQGYVSHLRRVLEPEAGPGEARDILVTQAPGYALRADALTVDATRFERLAGDGRRALEDGSPSEAAALLDEALALWRGPALAEFAFDDFARNEIDRLEQLRLSATEDRIDALLRLGRHGELTGELDSLVAAHPLRERLRGQWMLALYRSGRQADALQAYRDGRRLLAGELGLEPGPELQRIERAILAQDPALESAAPEPAPPPPRAVTPDGQPEPRRRAGVRRRRVVIGGVLVASAAVALALAAWWWREDAPASIRVTAPAVVAVDAKTNRIVASIRAGSAPSAIAAGEGGIWVGDARDGTVTRIDPSARRVVRTIGIGAPAIDLTTGLGSVWVATGSFGTILRIDARLNEKADSIDLTQPNDPVVPTASAVEVVDGRLWVGAFAGLVRIDPRSHAQRQIDLGESGALQIAADAGTVWATFSSRRAKRVEARSGRESGEFYAGRFVLPIALGTSAVWLAGGDSGLLWKVDRETTATIGTWQAGHGTSAIALGAGAVWVASWSEHALLRVDPASGEVLATIPLAGDPADVIVHDGMVWVAVQVTPADG
jgi:DNA-binding SARP family transcriptional activator